VVSPTEIGDNPQLQTRRFLETLQHPRVGPVRYPRPPIAPANGGFVTRPAPTLGEHNREVLCGLLGVSAEEFAQLERDAVIGTSPVR
jgi:crotonobetainyl-CoA:carnitine CoA-transferase CaiB-like acyl-CoA transferase